MSKLIKTTLLLIICLFITNPLLAMEWVLDTDSSSVSFVTTKRIHTAEPHIFSDFTGSISESGIAQVLIKPASVNTILPERAIEFIQSRRNDRMREFLFETHLYPEIKVELDTSPLPILTVGQTIRMSFPATLSLHGVENQITTHVLVSMISEKIMTVASTTPVIIHADDYNLSKGLIKLSSFVNNITLSKSVPVNFTLTFNRVSRVQN